MHNSICSLLQGVFLVAIQTALEKAFAGWATSAQHHFPRPDGGGALCVCVCVFHHPTLHFPGPSDKRTWNVRGRSVLPWHCPVWHWKLSLAQCFWWVKQRLWGGSSGEVPRAGIRRERASWVWQHGGCGEELWKDSNLSFKGEDKKGNFLRIQRSFCSYRLLPWETSVDWEQGRKKGCAMHRDNEQGWDLAAISMFHLAEPTFLYPAVIYCPTALILKFKSAIGVLECFEQKVRTSPSHSSEHLKVLSQFRCGLGDFVPLRVSFPRVMLQN